MRNGFGGCLSDPAIRGPSFWSTFGASPSKRLPIQELFDALGKLPIGIAICDRGLRFVTVNRKLAEINKIPADDHPGKLVCDFVGSLAPTIESRLMSVFSTARPVKNAELDGQLGMNPEPGHWIENYFPIFDGRNRVKQVGVLVLSISDLRLRSAPSTISSRQVPIPNLEPALAMGSDRRKMLSSRETDVLQLLADGKSTKEAASSLGIGVKTVETYRTKLKLKLQAHSVADLVHYAIRHHLGELH